MELIAADLDLSAHGWHSPGDCTLRAARKECRVYRADQRERWLALAETLTPSLHQVELPPQCLVEPEEKPAVFQGWQMRSLGPSATLFDRVLARGDSFTLDFGEHTVGHLQLTVVPVGMAMDAPLRLTFVFGEVPAEVGEPFDPFDSTLSRAWLQDEVLNIDVLPQTIRLPRRYAFRYVKIAVVDTSPEYRVQVTGISCITTTSAAGIPDRLPSAYSTLLHELDRVSLQTLKNCMHTVFEDGPKRDRRLWLGDLRLQALTNYVSFKHYDLVKRCLYLFAGLAHADGLVPACVFEQPAPQTGHVDLLDYAALFGPTLLDYARASGDWTTAQDLWPVALRQIELLSAYVDQQGLFDAALTSNVFIDWQPALDKQTSMQGVLIYALRQTRALAQAIHQERAAAFIPSLIDTMTHATHEHLFDADERLYASGPERQISWASHAWLVLAGVLNEQAGAASFQSLLARSQTIKPAGPYLYHHVVAAMLACKMTREAHALLQIYWGGMLARGATTFWEVFDPAQPLLSPYNNHLINSYCHAWSCTPAYFIRSNGAALLEYPQ